VDPFIQFPSNSQSLNPYSYLMNNPLAGVDPTGYKSCSKVSSLQENSSGECDADGGTVQYSFDKKGTLTFEKFKSNGSNIANGASTPSGDVSNQRSATPEADQINADRQRIAAPAAIAGSTINSVGNGIAAATVCSNDSQNCAGEMATNAAIGFGIGAAIASIPKLARFVNSFRKSADEITGSFGALSSRIVDLDLDMARANRGLTRAGSGSGPWIDEVSKLRQGGAVAQMTGGSCVAACGEMLTNGAAVQRMLLDSLGDWSNAESLANKLGSAWKGGGLSAEDALLVARNGPIGAVLNSPYQRGSHMVYMEPINSGLFLVRDPWNGGSTYQVNVDWVQKYVVGAVFR